MATGGLSNVTSGGDPMLMGLVIILTPSNGGLERRRMVNTIKDGA